MHRLAARSFICGVLSLAVLAQGAGCNLDDDGADLAGLIGKQFVPLGVGTDDVSGAFLTSSGLVAPASWLVAAKKEFGRDPKRVELASIKLRVNSPSVEDWSYLWTGEVVITFVPASSETAIVVAKGTPPSSFADFSPKVSASSDSFDDFPDIAAGNFEIRVSGPTGRKADENFSQQVVMELEFLVF